MSAKTEKDEFVWTPFWKALRTGLVVFWAIVIARTIFYFASGESARYDAEKRAAEAWAPHATATAMMEFGLELEKIWDLQLERGIITQAERDSRSWNAETRAMREGTR